MAYETISFLKGQIIARDSTAMVNDIESIQKGLDAAATKKFFGIIDVKDYGAVGDDVTDDGEALQAALDAAEGKTLRFTPWYKYRSKRKLNVRFRTFVDFSGASVRFEDIVGFELSIGASLNNGSVTYRRYQP